MHDCEWNGECEGSLGGAIGTIIDELKLWVPGILLGLGLVELIRWIF